MSDSAPTIFDAGDFDPREAAPLIWQVMRDDWEAPEMDAYDHYPEQP